MEFFMELILNIAMILVAIVFSLMCLISLTIAFFRTRQNAEMYIVFEGIDGSGKETQSKLLEEYLMGLGKSVVRISYPEYGKWHCRLVEMYLAGTFGKNAMTINPLVASLFYAIDRFFSMYVHSKEFDSNTVVIFDRYVTSNMLFQLAKLDTLSKRIKLREKLEWIEYELFKLPKPTIVFNMHINPDFAISVINTRKNNKHGASSDIHEVSPEILKKASNVANELSIMLGWKVVNVSEMVDINLYRYKSQEVIKSEIIGHIKDLYAKRSKLNEPT